MTSEEILEELESLFIITKIGDSYFMTDKYKDFDVQTTENSEELEEPISILKVAPIISDWDKNVTSSEGRTKAVAIMDLCSIPTYSLDKYRLRVLNKEAIQIATKITRNKNIRANIFVEAIKQYYKMSKSPKNFKNLLIDGDALDIYEEFIDRRTNADKLDPIQKPNSTWG